MDIHVCVMCTIPIVKIIGFKEYVINDEECWNEILLKDATFS